MRRACLLGLLGLGIFGWRLPARAFDALYRPDPTSVSRLGTAPGQPLPGPFSIRRLSSPADLGALSVHERQTIQPNYRYRAMFTPNDPQYGLQWNFSAINIPAAWDLDQTPPRFGGDPQVIVALLDTGLAFEDYLGTKTVPDFDPVTVWTNTREIAGNGLDDDGNGYVDDIHGWNFIDDDAHPVDTNGHGTHLAGIIAAATNNSLATAGIAFNSTIMPLKVLDRAGDGSTAALITAVNYAVANGATIINLSLGGDQDDPLFHQVIQTAVAKGAMVISAAGNSGLSTITYPARYPEVVSVGAVQADLTRSAYANYGPTLDLVAPGGNDQLDQNSDGFLDGIAQQTCRDTSCATFATMFYTGTSQATAHVTAVAALVAACGVSTGSIRGLLTSTAKDLGPDGRDAEYGYGLVDAAAALTVAGCPSTTPLPPGPITAVVKSGSTLAIVPGRPTTAKQPLFTWIGPVGATYRLTWKLGTKTISQPTQTATTFAPSIDTEGSYQLSVRIVDSLGRTTTPVTFLYRYRRAVVVISQDVKIQLYSSQLKPIRTITPTIAGAEYQASGGTLTHDYANRLLVTNYPAGPTITVTDTQGKRLASIQPFGRTFVGTIATAILQRADYPPLILAATSSRGAALAWYSATGQLIGRNQLYRDYTGGLTVSAGDLDGDGNDEAVVGQLAGPEIRVYRHDRQRLRTIVIAGADYRGGWALTTGNFQGDGRDAILVTQRRTNTHPALVVLNIDGQRQQRWTMSGWPVKTEVVLATADLNGDGRDEPIIVGRQGKQLQRLTERGSLRQRLDLPTSEFTSLSSL